MRQGLWEEEGFPQKDDSQEKKDDSWNNGASCLYFQGGMDVWLMWHGLFDILCC
jgi:hypothetical protein